MTLLLRPFVVPSMNFLEINSSSSSRVGGANKVSSPPPPPHLASAAIFLISLKAGGTGLNLTAADYVFHLDPWWNPAVEEQAIDRGIFPPYQGSHLVMLYCVSDC